MQLQLHARKSVLHRIGKDHVTQKDRRRHQARLVLKRQLLHALL